MLLRASAAEMKRSRAPFSEAWLDREGLTEEAWLFHDRWADDWACPVGRAALSSGLESVMVLSLPDSSSAEPLSELDALSISSLSASLPSLALSCSFSCSTCAFDLAGLLLVAGVGMRAGLRLRAFL